MRRALAIVLTISAISSQRPSEIRAAQTPPELKEIAFVANAEAATVALVDVTARSIVGVIDVNPARAQMKGPGATNYAQDTDVSPDGRKLYVSRGYLGDVAAFDIATAQLLWQRSLNTGRADHMTITLKTDGACSSGPDGQQGLSAFCCDRRDRRSSGDRRLSSRQQDLEG